MKRILASMMATAVVLAMLSAAAPAYGQKSLPPATPTPCSDSNTATHLLFPFMTNSGGYDTGFTIANTAADPFGTPGAAGTCSLTFYGPGAPAAITTTSVAQGALYTNLMSTIAPGYQGYMIASCKFPFAHGFTFVSDVGAKNVASSYLPTTICPARVAPD